MAKDIGGVNLGEVVEEVFEGADELASQVGVSGYQIKAGVVGSISNGYKDIMGNL